METLSHADVLASDQLSPAPVFVRTIFTLAAFGASPACPTAVNPFPGVICSGSAGLGSETCITMTAAEHPHMSGALVPIGVFHFCHAKFVVLRMLHAAFAFVV